MSKKRTLRQVAVAIMLLVAFLFQGTWALAGTTGGLNGTVTDDNGAAIAGADVKVISASQSASATTDNTGRFNFLSLAPDTYTVSIEKNGYNPISYAGVTVFADNQTALAFKMTKALKEIAKVSARASGALVKAGTTSDVYSVNSATAAKVTGVGGGGSLDQAYSAIATMPGAYVPVGQAGWYQYVYIRGGDYDQVGYEVDGVPVNRSFDNYPSSTASALGQQEVQVYTGASPANSEGQGLSGYINQVIKAGTYPGFATSDIGVGFPAFYHKANVEVGGATPDRLFSYYVGIGGYNQDHRSFDNSNGAAISSLWGTPAMDCKSAAAPTLAGVPSCYSNGVLQNGAPGTLDYLALAPYQVDGTPDFSDRETVMNFHFGIPHHRDGGRDDLQLLYQSSQLVTNYANAASDFTTAFMNATYGSPQFCFFAGVGPCGGTRGLQYNGQLGQTFSSSAALAAQASQVVPYSYPSAGYLGNGGNIPSTQRDDFTNGLGIFKLQYQKNFGSNAYARLYGYTMYSDWLNYGPNALSSFYGFGPPYDYELESHTRGISGTFADQLNAHNLLQIQGSYLTATSLRDNNTQMYRATTPVALQVSSANPTNGICYDSTGAATGCSGAEAGNPQKVTLKGLFNAGTTPLPALAGSCGGAPCQWLAVDNGLHATYNMVTPKFGAFSITDEWDPVDRLHLNLGLRYDSYSFVPQNTDTGMRNFWFNAWNASNCYDTTNRIAGVVSLAAPMAGGATTAACQAAFGSTFAPATLSPNSVTQTFNVWQPRVGATFTVNALNVLRFSYGKYDQAPNTAFEQYNTLQQNLPAIFAQGTRGGFNLFGFGRNSPTYPIRPELSYNTDFSWEHQFKGTDASFKVTPFYRKTQDQIEQFFLDLATGFVSGLNVGSQISQGVELQVQKGDFSREGFSGLFSYTYTDAKIKYSNLASGSSLFDPINQQIATYNSYTSACAANPSAAGCSYKGKSYLPSNGSAAAPCFTTAGAPDPTCASANAIANPYWNDKPKAFVDPNGSYAPYDLFQALTNYGSYGSFVAPSVATLVLNYKHDKWAITPALQFSSGSHYGYALSTLGVDPAAGCASLLTAPNAARNPGTYTAGGTAYDGTSGCGYALNIPNPATGNFDSQGAFTNPSRYTLSTQFTYEFNPRVTGVLTLSNIIDSCSGGTSASWTNVPGVARSKVCGFGGVASGTNPPVGNNYNPGQALQPMTANSYGPQFGSLPFNAYFDLKIKL